MTIKSEKMWREFLSDIASAVEAEAVNEVEKEVETMREDVRVCEVCGAIIEDGDEFETVEGTVCEECYYDHFRECEECGDAIRDEDGVAVYDMWGDVYEIVCEDCAERYYNYCDECGRYFTDSAFDFDSNTCRECAPPETIAEYHAGNPNGLQFHGDAEWSAVERLFAGVELEISGGYDWRERNECAAEMLAAAWDSDGYDTLHFERDCSVEGFECIFQPRTVEEWRAHVGDLQRMLDVARNNGYSAEEGNSLHVHLSREALGRDREEQVETIAKLMRLFDGSSFKLMQTAARASDEDVMQWAAPAGVRGGSHEDVKRSIVNYDHGRYEAVNVTNRATVEIRLGRSTLDAREFVGWIELLAYTVKRARTITPEAAENFDEWFYRAPESVRNYLWSHEVPVYEPARLDTERVSELMSVVAARLRSIARAAGGDEPSTESILRGLGVTPAELRMLNVR